MYNRKGKEKNLSFPLVQQTLSMMQLSRLHMTAIKTQVENLLLLHIGAKSSCRRIEQDDIPNLYWNNARHHNIAQHAETPWNQTELCNDNSRSVLARLAVR